MSSCKRADAYIFSPSTDSRGPAATRLLEGATLSRLLTCQGRPFLGSWVPGFLGSWSLSHSRSLGRSPVSPPRPYRPWLFFKASSLTCYSLLQTLLISLVAVSRFINKITGICLNFPRTAGIMHEFISKYISSGPGGVSALPQLVFTLARVHTHAPVHAAIFTESLGLARRCPRCLGYTREQQDSDSLWNR